MIEHAMASYSRAACAILSLLCAAGGSHSCADEPTRNDNDSTAALIEKLASPRFAEREDATKKLSLREDALPHIRRALKSSNPEIARRAKVILAAIEHRTLDKFLGYGRDGRIDLLCEYLASRQSDADREKIWQGVIDIGVQMLQRARPQAKPPPAWEEKKLPGSSFREFLKSRPEFITDETTPESVPEPAFLTVRRDGRIGGAEIDRSLIVTAGPVHVQGHLFSSIVFSCGDVKADYQLSRCYVVADGDVHAYHLIDNVIAARGNLHVKRVFSETNTTAHIGGRLILEPSRIKGKSPLKAKLDERPKSFALKAACRRPLGFVRFFETSDVGIELTGTKVVALNAASPLRKAGLLVGDMLLAIDGKEAKDAESIRRMLRRALIQQEGRVTVKRGQKKLNLQVSFAAFDIRSTGVSANADQPR